MSEAGKKYTFQRPDKVAHVSSLQAYEELYSKSVNDPEGFWADLAAKNFHFEQTWQKVLQYNFDRRKGKVFCKWFDGALTNICYNAIDRHVIDGHGEQVAFYWEGNDEGEEKVYTYKQVLDAVCKCANFLKRLGVEKGDRVAMYLPMVAELPISMLACARIGAIHSVVFGGFSSESLAGRLLDCKAKVVITADGVLRGKKHIALKAITDEACHICKDNGFNVPNVVVVQRMGQGKEGCEMHPPRDHYWQDLEDTVSAECPVEWVESEHPLFMLYTSGSTGKPKGVLHTTAGYMVWSATTHKLVFDYQPGDVYWCTADCGWITGHSYITYGPMLNRATQVLFEGIPSHPNCSRFWKVCEKYKVTSFYTAPTAVRALMGQGEEKVKSCDLSALRVLGTVGEPINPEAWKWYYNVVGGGKCPISDTWWQTETGGHMITPLPFATPQVPGSATRPFLGVQPVVLDTESKELEGEASGFLCIKFPWPGMMRTIYGDHERFEQVYFDRFKGYYMSGDGCRRDSDANYWLTGRVDDVINVSGHRIGTAEIESALVSHPACVEAAVVGYPHDIKGEGLYCFVTLAAGQDQTEVLRKELREIVRSEIGAFASPDVIHWAPGLPKTRSGKIMRRILRKLASMDDDQLGDISTLADPSVVQTLIDLRGK